MKNSKNLHGFYSFLKQESQIPFGDIILSIFEYIWWMVGECFILYDEAGDNKVYNLKGFQKKINKK